MIYKLNEYQTGSGKWQVLCEQLVGTGKGWKAPAIVTGLDIPNFVKLLQSHGAKVEAMKGANSSTIAWLNYSWDNQSDMRKFKNLINAEARKKNILIKSL